MINKMRDLIVQECDCVKKMLIEKNKAYGNSALNPVRIFSKADPLEQIKIRIDDKLSRIKRGSTFGHEDTKMDLIGYLILERVAERIEQHAKDQNSDSLPACEDIGNRKVY